MGSDSLESELLDRQDSTEILQRQHVSLSKFHMDDLRRSGLSEETIRSSGVYSAHHIDVSELLGFKTASGGLVIPYLNVEDDTYARVKLDEPGRDGKHYRSPKGSQNRLYVPPLLPSVLLSDATQPLLITEGEKKALKGCQEGLSCVALSGVWSWRTKDEGNKSVPISDFDSIEWKGRIVTIVFDSDAAKNVEVARAEKELARELARRGATVFVVRLPADGREKVGLDDYLVKYSIEAFRCLPLVQVAPQILAVGLGSFLSREFPPAVPLIKGILSSEGSGWIAGEEKLGKSIYALEEALCLALGIPVCQTFEVPERQRVLFIEEEDSPPRVKGRVDALLRGHGFDPDDPEFRAELDQWFQVSVWQSVTLDDPDMVSNLGSTIERFKPRVVYLDVLRKLTTRDLSPQAEASKLVNILDDLRRRHACIFRVLHHYRKGQGHGRSGRGSQEISGSYVLGAWAEVSLFFEPIGKQIGVAKLQVQTKDGLPPDAFKLVIESEGPNEAPTSYRLRIEELGKDAKAQEFKEKVHGLVGSLEPTNATSGQPGVSVKSIHEALDLKPDNNGPRKALKALEQEGRLARVGTTSKGAHLYRQSGQ